MALSFPDSYLNVHTLGAALAPTFARNYTPRMFAEFREVTPVVFSFEDSVTVFVFFCTCCILSVLLKKRRHVEGVGAFWMVLPTLKDSLRDVTWFSGWCLIH